MKAALGTRWVGMVLPQGKALTGFEVGVWKGLVFTSPPGMRGQSSGLLGAAHGVLCVHLH